MRIAIDARYAGIRPSGIGRYTEALLERVPRLAEGDVLEAWLSPRARVAATGFVARPVAPRANHLPTLLAPTRLAPLDGVDVFHAPFNILGRGIPCRTVATIHDLMWLEAPALCQPHPVLRAVQRRFYADGIGRALRADHIIAPSRATADAIVARAPSCRGRVTVIPHGVSARHRPGDGAHRCRALGLDRPFLLVVGQNAPYKNHDAIVAAYVAARLAPGVALALVERLAPRRTRARGIVHLPVLDDDDLVALLQSALAVVQFSRQEGFGMPALEAMACGAPVIASDIPALREITAGAAKLVPLRIASLSAAMRAIASDRPLRDDLRGRGLERARAFSWDAAARAHLEIYRAVGARG